MAEENPGPEMATRAPGELEPGPGATRVSRWPGAGR